MTLSPRLAGLVSESFGYRCAGVNKHSWIAAYLPQTNQVLTNPMAHHGAVKAALVEEFAHASTIAFRPPQLYPITNYLCDMHDLPGVDCFRDIVEAVYFASWPLIRDRRTIARHMPPWPCAERDLGGRILALARHLSRFAVKRLERDHAEHQATWAITMVLMFVVPIAPGQCATVLGVLEQIPEHRGWRDSTALFRHLFEGLQGEIGRRENHPLPFLLAAPNEPHANVTVMFDLVNRMLQIPSDEILPIFPTMLTITTMQTTGFIPLILLREREGRIRAGVELWDQTNQYVSTRLSILKDRAKRAERRSSGLVECKTVRFYEDFIRSVAARVRAGRRQRTPADVFEFALGRLRSTAMRKLSALWNGCEASCPHCRHLIQREVVHEAVESMAQTPQRRIRDIVTEVRQYERWITSTGFKIISAQLKQHFGWDLPIEPMRSSSSDSSVIWRTL